MTDFNTHVAFTCVTNRQFRTSVKGSNGKVYIVQFRPMTYGPVQYDWTCECQGFKFRKHCSHIDKTKFAGIRCGWNSCLEIGIEPDRTGDFPTCPECGERALPVEVAA